ncbi:MAG: leucine-rich repeat protein [Fibromonadaceae bacterium]|jgi:uncharacterized protein (TIGR02145 family)|nr:leucine-rich repeat protein [Fibromonadaceae bacterium]
MNRVKLTLLAAASIAALCFTACEQYDDESDFRVAPLDGGKSMEITKYVGQKQTVRIPSRLQGKPVASIGKETFKGKGLISVIIPNSVTTIGEHAFAENQLTSVSIPKNVTIGAGAFTGNQLATTVAPVEFTDSRDGKKYKAIKIGYQFSLRTWMAENLNFNASSSVCYENSESNCSTYGRLYNWSTALNACPAGWRLPNNAEWQELVDFVGNNAGTKLKIANGWNGNGNGTDDFGFSALPGGIGDSDGSFDYVGNYGYWWSATESDARFSYFRSMSAVRGDVGRIYYPKTGLLSVRCVQD